MSLWWWWACKVELLEPPSPPQGTLMVADTGHGRLVLADRSNAQELGSLCLEAVLPDRCTPAEGESVGCLLFGATWDPAAATLDFTYGAIDPDTEGFAGGMARVDPVAGTMTWDIHDLDWESLPTGAACVAHPELLSCGFDMPHTGTWWPEKDLAIIADTLNNRVLFVEPREGMSARVVAILDSSSADLEGHKWPNNAELVDVGGVSYLLVTFKGSDDDLNLGRIMLVDLQAFPFFDVVWRYPEDGGLAAVHHGTLQDADGDQWIVYAHSKGAGDAYSDAPDGSVGLAHWNGLTPPDYRADLKVFDPLSMGFGFVREAEFIDDGATMLITDSGCENQSGDCGQRSRVLEVATDFPDGTGLTGAYSLDHGEQRFVDTPGLRDSVRGVLQYPFETDLVELGQPWKLVDRCAP